MKQFKDKNGTTIKHGLPPNINDMWSAVERMKNMSPVPLNELKLHPADYAHCGGLVDR